MKEIYTAINKAMIEMPAIPKDSTNEQQKWKFRSIDAIVDNCRTIISSNGLMIIPETLESTVTIDLIESVYNGSKSTKRLSTAKVLVKYTISHVSGESISATIPGYSQDYADKATGQAMTFAFKQMLSQVFMLGFEDDPDKNTIDTTTTVTTTQPAKQTPAQQQNTQKPQQPTSSSTTIKLTLGEDATKELIKEFFANAKDFKAKYKCEIYKINGVYKIVELGYFEKQKQQGTGK